MQLSSLGQSLRLGVYEHYKQKRYEVIGVAHHSETLEELVMYKQLYGDEGYFVRPLAMFVEHVVVNGETVPRFRLIDSV